MTPVRTSLVPLALALPLFGCGELWRPFLDPGAGNPQGACGVAGSPACDLATPFEIPIGTDGGIMVAVPQWFSEKTPVATDLYSVQLTAPGRAVAVGDQSTVLNWDLTKTSANWSVGASSVGSKPYTAVATLSAADVFIASAEGTVLHYDGATPPVANPPCSGGSCSAPFGAIWATALDGVWVGGGGGQAYRLASLLANSWTTVPVTGGATETVTAIWGTAQKDVWFGGNQATLHHFDGTNYNKYPVPGQLTVRGIWGNSDSNVWAVGDRGLVIRWGGTLLGWVQQDTKAANPTALALRAITGNNQGELWAVGDSGTILYYNV